MNVAFYSAVAFLPLGVAATLLYLGPFAIAAFGFRRGLHLALPACALIGVLMISRPGSIDSLTGLIVGLISGAALATYTIAGHRLGHKGGTDTLALAVASSAVILSPVSLLTTPHLRSEHAAVLLTAGVIGVACAFWFDFTALQLIGSRAVSVLFALDPVVGAITGALMLGQHLDLVTTLGIIAIVISGAIAAGTQNDSRKPQN
ncbi:EamA family transporter [Nesterenkonia ebinurensis]|uniref:EamA family transporter n=1 Tax=Nesterenkonia ebinurensis TaxID=2608252 RepID=UPI00168B7F46|nr:EamA family transporter [Nesterenkonia ebinurensis]